MHIDCALFWFIHVFINSVLIYYRIKIQNQSSKTCIIILTSEKVSLHRCNAVRVATFKWAHKHVRFRMFNRVWWRYLQESAWIIFFEDFQAVLHHAGSLAQFHGAVCDLVTYDLKWMYERGETNRTRHRFYWAALESLVCRNMTVLTWQQQVLFLALFHLFKSTCVPMDIRHYLRVHTWAGAELDLTGSHKLLVKGIEAQSTVTVSSDCMFTSTPALHFNTGILNNIIGEKNRICWLCKSKIIKMGNGKAVQ